MYLTLLVCYQLIVAALACQFPEFMQTNGTQRDWRGRVRNQFTEFTTRVLVEDSMLRVVATDPSAKPYTHVCLQMVREGFYLAAHEESGQEGTRYTCVQFLRRSANVVQLRTANVSRRMDEALCREESMRTDPWLIIDKTHIGSEQQVCALQGGYTIRIFDKVFQRSVCDAYEGDTRLESECHQGEGLRFYFRRAECVPENLYMYVSQRTICTASWTEGKHNFLLLKHDLFNYMWLLRYPSAPSVESFSAYLLMDLVADEGRLVSITRNYARLDAVREPASPVSSLCVDEYEICSMWSAPCSSMHLTCPRTCGFCNATRPNLCRFPSSWQGSWYEGGNARSMAANITSSVVSIHGKIQEDFHCINWDMTEDQDKSTHQQMLVYEFDNGCRPRYTCMQVTQSKHASVIQVKLSQAKLWPFTSSPTEPVDCSHFSYDSDEKFMDNKFRTKYQRLLYKPTSTDQLVNCGLPRDMRNFAMQLANGTSCTGSVTQTANKKGLTVDYRDCNVSAELPSSSYSCLQSTRLPARDIVIITKANDPLANRLYCWLFPRRPRSKFYLLSGEHCSESVSRRIESGKISPVIIFSKTRKVAVDNTTLSTTPRMEPMDVSGGQGVDVAGNVTSEESDDSTNASPYVVMAAVVLFALFQIPCICKNA